VTDSEYRCFFDSDIGADGLVRRDISCDDAALARKIAGVLRSLLGHSPSPVSEISTGLQGNLCEFCAWDLGEKHWGLYTRELTWPANANSPWRNKSESGVDILALDTNADRVFLIEVKSSRRGGSGAVAGEDKSLQADFRHLFEGSLDERIWDSVDEAVSDLIIHNRPDLAEKVKSAVGSKPEECTGVRLIGVLICRSGKTRRSRDARQGAFQRLHQWLLSQGWQADQCEYHCVELSDFAGWLSRVVNEVIDDNR